MPPDSPFEPEELAGVLAPLGDAVTLPGRAYADPRVFAFEREAWFERDWIYVGRSSDAPAPGDWFLAPITTAGVIVLRDPKGALRAFHNVCRHRGLPILDPGAACGAKAERLHCPYHGWTYGLDGRRLPVDAGGETLAAVRLEEVGGFLFATLAWDGPSLIAWLDDLPAQLDGIPLDDLATGHTARHEVAANWKLLMENFAESYHFALVHPQLEDKTPSSLAESLESRGPWQGGYMPLAPPNETVSLDGLRHGRVPLRKYGPRKKGALDYLLFPNLFMSLQPDYLLVYRLEPIAEARTRVVFQVLFDPASAEEGTFDAPDVYDFWSLTNRQDFSICERQQLGVASPGYVPGKYTSVEEGVHEFDKIVAQRYADP